VARKKKIESTGISLQVTAVELADLLQLTPARISQLAKQKVFSGRKSGRNVLYDVRASVHAYITLLRSGSEDSSGTYLDDEYKRWRIRKVKAETLERERRVISREEVAEHGAIIGAVVKGVFDEMTGDLPGQLSGLNEQEIQQRLIARFTEACTTLDRNIEDMEP
jgi:phage terminase Nu1 subunit (DNA packaging protein)